MNKAIVLLPLAFVIGGVVGYWNNADDVRIYKEQAAAAEKQAASGKKGGGEGFGTFAQMMQIPKEAKRPPRRKGPPESAEGGNTNAVAAAEAPGANENTEPQEEFNPEDLRARIDEAADLWRARIDVAKAAAVDRLGLDAEGRRKFEASLATMNDRIRDSIQIIAESIANDEKMTHETNVRLLGDLATTIAETYDGIGECVDESRRGEVSEMMLLEFIDPSVAEPLISVQDKIEGGVPAGGGRNRQ